MMLTAFLILFVVVWYISMIVQTHAYLAKNDIHFSVSGIIILPIILLSLHMRMFFKEKDKKLGFRYFLLYFVNYKLSVIFLAELLLENVAMTQTVGYSPHISKKEQDKEGKTWLERVKDLIRLPETTNSFEEVLMAT